MSNASNQINFREGLFKNACRIHLEPLVMRYLIDNSAGRLNGYGKANGHREMCQFYVSVFRGEVDPSKIRVNSLEYLSVHEATKALTDYMDEAIGFPMSEVPHYERLEPLFFEQFHKLACQALSEPTEEIG